MLHPDGHPILARTLDIAMWGLKPVRRRVIPWATGKVLEIGCGTGANFEMYRGIESLTAIEPDPHMRVRAERAAETVDFPVSIHAQSGAALDFEDESFDTVVASFVLCTIPDPERAAKEMFRVLRPEGMLVFAEHVCAAGRGTHALQHRMTPLWSRLAGGCRLDNDAVRQLHDAGFSLDIRSPERSNFDPFPIVYGFGKKGALRPVL